MTPKSLIFFLNSTPCWTDSVRVLYPLLAPWSGVCECMCKHTRACPHWPARRYRLRATGDSDYFRPVNALFILAVSLWLELIAADYTVWKGKDGHQQFCLGDKNIIMQNKTDSWGLESRNSLSWRKIRPPVTKNQYSMTLPRQKDNLSLFRSSVKTKGSEAIYLFEKPVVY